MQQSDLPSSLWQCRNARRAAPEHAPSFPAGRCAGNGQVGRMAVCGKIRGPLHIQKPASAAMPDFFRSCSAQRSFDAEITLQFQMGPVIYRTADEFRHNSSEFGKFCVIRSPAGHVFFCHAADTHAAPLIMIRFQPDLRQVIIAAALINVLCRQMVVIVNNRSLFCMIKEQLASRLRSQKEVFIHKGFHTALLLCIIF